MNADHTSRPTPLPELPPTWLRESGPDKDLPALFAASAESAGCRVWRSDEAGWVDVILQILGSHAAYAVLVEGQPDTALGESRVAALCEALRANQVVVVTQCDDQALFSVDAAVTAAQAAVAETGTIVCLSGPAAARGTSLIPPLHIAVVGASAIVPDLFDLFEELSRRPLPASVCLITGPSKTADIEGVLVTGVHGPGAVHIVLID